MAASATRHVQLWGAQVTDDAGYRSYREQMRPILERHGGGFCYDFVVSQVLINESGRPINRAFTIAFPTAQHAEAFFADPAYLAVRREWFEPSVASIIKLAAFDEA